MKTYGMIHWDLKDDLKLIRGLKIRTQHVKVQNHYFI